MDPSQFMTDFLEISGDPTPKPRMSLPRKDSVELPALVPPQPRRKQQAPEGKLPNKRPPRPPQGSTNPLLKLTEFFSPAKWFGGGSSSGKNA